MNKAIITGPTGAVGLALLEALTARGVECCAACHKGSARIARLPQNPLVKVVECDGEDYDRLPSLAGQADVFVHLAWNKTSAAGRDDLDAQLDNVRYTLAAVRAAKACGCSVFIGAGSQAEYGPVTQALSGETPVCPQSGYGIAKYAAGRLAANLCKQLGLRFNWARILSVYGAGDGENTLISYLIRTLRDGGVPELTPCGQIWDYLNSRDCAAALIAIAESGADGKTYCLGSGRGLPLKAYAEAVRDEIAPGAELGFGKKDYYPHQPMFLVADIGELTADTGWTPRVAFREGIREIARR